MRDYINNLITDIRWFITIYPPDKTIKNFIHYRKSMKQWRRRKETNVKITEKDIRPTRD